MRRSRSATGSWTRISSNSASPPTRGWRFGAERSSSSGSARRKWRCDGGPTGRGSILRLAASSRGCSMAGSSRRQTATCSRSCRAGSSCSSSPRTPSSARAAASTMASFPTWRVDHGLACWLTRAARSSACCGWTGPVGRSIRARPPSQATRPIPPPPSLPMVTSSWWSPPNVSERARSGSRMGEARARRSSSALPGSPPRSSGDLGCSSCCREPPRVFGGMGSYRAARPWGCATASRGSVPARAGTVRGGWSRANPRDRCSAILQTDPDIVRRRLLALPLEVGRAQGEPCFTGAECASAFCVDGACCESACEGGCEACSAAWGGVEDGRCTPVSAGWTCRAAREGCDLEERCDGTSTACPPDARIPPGEICRPSAGPCDVPERCGSSTWCPEDGFDDSGAVCRRAVSACDADEVCDGLMAECPADWVEAPGTVCRPASGACDVDDVCDGLALHCGFDARAADGAACGDGDACNGEEVCARGVCAEGRPLRCDDGDRCTADACDAALGCTHTPVEPCCGTHRDCDDGDACTVDRCGDGDCAHRRVEGCCTVDADCGAGSRCRDTRCAPAHDAGAVDPGARPPTAGCGCRATVRGGGGLAWLLLLGLALLRRQRP